MSPDRWLEVAIRVDEDISRHGWSVISARDAGRGRPAFVQTIGLVQSFDHPELVVVGNNPFRAGLVLMAMAILVEDGAQYTCWSQPSIGGCTFATGRVHKRHHAELAEFWRCYWELEGDVSEYRSLQVFLPDDWFTGCGPELRYQLDDPRPLVPRRRKGGRAHRRRAS